MNHDNPHFYWTGIYCLETITDWHKHPCQSAFKKFLHCDHSSLPSLFSVFVPIYCFFLNSWQTDILVELSSFSRDSFTSTSSHVWIKWSSASGLFWSYLTSLLPGGFSLLLLQGLFVFQLPAPLILSHFLLLHPSPRSLIDFLTLSVSALSPSSSHPLLFYTVFYIFHSFHPSLSIHLSLSLSLFPSLPEVSASGPNFPLRKNIFHPADCFFLFFKQRNPFKQLIANGCALFFCFSVSISPSSLTFSESNDECMVVKCPSWDVMTLQLNPYFTSGLHQSVCQHWLSPVL